MHGCCDSYKLGHAKNAFPNQHPSFTCPHSYFSFDF